jgi:hypothetical protein
MSFAISDYTKNLMTGIVFQVWNTTDGLLAPVTIYKEPIQTVVSAPSNLLYGYSTDQTQNSEVTYTPVYQTFSGQVLYPKKPKGGNMAYFDEKFQLETNKTYLRAQQDVFDYINNGQKTEKITVDGKSWNYKGNTQQQNFLNLKFFYFEIEATN